MGFISGNRHDGGGGETLPAGIIVLWSGLLSAIPSGGALCDGGGGRPDLRAKFVKGAAPGLDPGGAGGSPTHTHAQHSALSHAGGGVQDHPSQAHAGVAVQDHPAQSHADGDVADHPEQAHSGAAVGDHAAQSHADGAVADHSNVAVPATATAAVKIGTAGATGADNAHTHTITSIVHSVTQAAAHAILSHSVTQAAAHALLTHSVTQPIAHAIIAHAVTQPGDHAALAHTVTQPGDHSAQSHDTVNHEPEYYAVAYIMKA